MKPEDFKNLPKGTLLELTEGEVLEFTMYEPRSEDIVGYIEGIGTLVYGADQIKRIIQPTKKLDWSKIPVDTLVQARNVGEKWSVLYFAKPSTTFVHGASSKTTKLSRKWGLMRLAPQEHQPWMPWFGGECPLPDGVMVAVVKRNESKETGVAVGLVGWSHDWKTASNQEQIIAYQLTGELAEGWEY